MWLRPMSPPRQRETFEAKKVRNTINNKREKEEQPNTIQLCERYPKTQQASDVRKLR